VQQALALALRQAQQQALVPLRLQALAPDGQVRLRLASRALSIQ
jgi:hypothetical protein